MTTKEFNYRQANQSVSSISDSLEQMINFSKNARDKFIDTDNEIHGKSSDLLQKLHEAHIEAIDLEITLLHRSIGQNQNKIDNYEKTNRKTD